MWRVDQTGFLLDLQLLYFVIAFWHFDRDIEGYSGRIRDREYQMLPVGEDIALLLAFLEDSVAGPHLRPRLLVVSLVKPVVIFLCLRALVLMLESVSIVHGPAGFEPSTEASLVDIRHRPLELMVVSTMGDHLARDIAEVAVVRLLEMVVVAFVPVVIKV